MMLYFINGKKMLKFKWNNLSVTNMQINQEEAKDSVTALQAHTLWHAVTLQKKNVGAGGWLSARGQKVVVFTGESHR